MRISKGNRDGKGGIHSLSRLINKRDRRGDPCSPMFSLLASRSLPFGGTAAVSSSPFSNASPPPKPPLLSPSLAYASSPSLSSTSSPSSPLSPSHINFLRFLSKLERLISEGEGDKLPTHEQILLLKGVEECISLFEALSPSLPSLSLAQYTSRVNHLINRAKKEQIHLVERNKLKEEIKQRRPPPYPRPSAEHHDPSLPHAALPILSSFSSKDPSVPSVSSSLSSSLPSSEAMDDLSPSLAPSPSPSVYEPRPLLTIDDIRSRLFARIEENNKGMRELLHAGKESLPPSSAGDPYYNPQGTVEDERAFESALADDKVLGDLSSLTSQLKDYVGEINTALKNDRVHLDNASNLMDINLSHVERENKRLKQWARASCGDSCLMAALIVGLFLIFMGMVMLMKIVPAPTYK